MKRNGTNRNDGLTPNERVLIERLMDAIESDIASYLSGIVTRMDALEATVVDHLNANDRHTKDI